MRRALPIAVLALALSSSSASASKHASAEVSYGPDPAQTMQVVAAPQAHSPLDVIVHGGGWTSGDNLSLRGKAKALAAAGLTSYTPNYRLADAETVAFPMEIEDVEAAVRYAIAHASEYNADPSKVFLIGGSAGGELVVEAALRMDEAQPGAIDGVTTLSGASDLWALVQENHGFGNDLAEALGVARLSDCVAGSACEVRARAASPAQHVTAAATGTTWELFESEGKELMPKGQYFEMKEALEGVGVEVAGRLVPGRAHAFSYWAEVKDEIVNWIQEHA